MINQPKKEQVETLTERESDGVLIVHKSLAPLGLWLFTTLILATIIISMILLFLIFTDRQSGINWLFATLVTVIFNIVLFGIVLYGILQWINKYYLIDTKKIVIRSGVFGTHETIYEMDQIAKVEENQTIFGKAFGYGEVRIYDNRGTLIALLESMPNPEFYAGLIECRCEAYMEATTMY